jgi:cation diffusion facilitator CzcD-associated flavoprotein CzcO
VAGCVTAANGERLYDVIVVGAGFGGLYAIHRLRGDGLKVLCLEASDDIGGVWHHNRYPGARCDVESLDYSYSFSPELQQEWSWTERYAAQPEILAYLHHVADRFDLRRDIRLDSRVTAAERDDEAGEWSIATAAGERFRTRFLVMATGALSAPKTPDLAGIERFAGPIYRTSSWPAEPVDFAGQTVGVFGTGSTGVQCIPEIAREAERLLVFQRTPSYTLPSGNGPLDPQAVAAVKARYEDYRAELRASRAGIPTPTSGEPGTNYSREEKRDRWDGCWQAGRGMPSHFIDSMTPGPTNDELCDYLRDKIRASVADPATGEALCPKTYPFGARRICLETGYLETYNRANVTLVDLRAEAFEHFTARGVRAGGRDYPLDAVVLAIGFDAFTGPVLRIDIRNGRGERLAERWAEGPRTYMGFMTAGFPNLFILTGPGSPSVLTNVVMMLEHDVDWVADCIAWLDRQDIARIEADESAQAAWMEHVAELAAGTLYAKHNSWYMGSNIPGKQRMFLAYTGGYAGFAAAAADVAADRYRGFVLG